MTTASSFTRPLRVLLAGCAPESSAALASWLGEGEGLEVLACGSDPIDSLRIAVALQPNVVLFDFHGLSDSTDHVVALFKDLSPAPAVFLLTHDGSPTMRRYCLRAQVNAIFDKTTELDALREALEQLARELAPSAPNHP